MLPGQCCLDIRVELGVCYWLMVVCDGYMDAVSEEMKMLDVLEARGHAGGGSAFLREGKT